MMEKEYKVLNETLIQKYADTLRNQEHAENTVKKYIHDLRDLLNHLNGESITKIQLVQWKEHLLRKYAVASVNSMLAAANGFLMYMGWPELVMKQVKIQKNAFLDENKELSKEEYIRLVRTAEQEGNKRLSLVIQTICATGIRVSELQFITVQAVRTGRTEVINKGKRRTVFLPDKLRKLLTQYVKKQKISDGTVFVTRTGRPLNRSNIWRDMKALCEKAGVAPDKVFPHNLRHLFARTHYALEKDLSRLADILGHSSVNTTRIYTAESGAVHARQVGRLGLVIT